MPSRVRRLYWDACVLLDYLNDHPERAPVISAILDQTSKGDEQQIATSSISIVEVAFAASEKDGAALDTAIEAAIDDLWNEQSVLRIVEFHNRIAFRAREIVRAALVNGWRLSPMDAIHLASAQYSQAEELHTYESSLFKYETLIGCRICEPYVPQPRLPGM